jgi:hypothetical protein
MYSIAAMQKTILKIIIQAYIKVKPISSIATRLK